MASSIPAQVAETIQTAHINRAPSATHDLNPTTSASEKIPVSLYDADDLDGDRSYERDGIDQDEDEEDIPYSVIKPRRRAAHLPPMPDLRFEQSYLHSISKADTWGKVAWITVRDQVMMPLLQGVLYNLLLLGWQSWNRNAQVHGSSVGARVRRWWYGVNNWPIPGQPGSARSRYR
ncbi:DUF1770-domain-containing protein [Sodiomyces alkalinus F11]|uniref:DUF1770-domain-containing protein n=1 Tax=Sodiomyces alkalinus (strain CBS 110278 / VKM F-3762 / F11) TaxID=1314773 RepID=A0A3N2PVJ4_SODAK|nr:DUF1770-domain-containing protein [Sodiomyces alkalinus F11]ROT38498.1 DUF1770-domain-containing protein [Sodiomyces alkalinus F11]